MTQNLCSNITNNVFHTIATYHVVAMSIVRYLAIASSKAIQNFTFRIVFLISGIIFVTVPILCTPLYLVSTVDVATEGRPW